MWHRLLLLTLLCGFTFQLRAQPDHYLSVASGAGLGKVRDKRVSSLIYSGLQVPSALGYIRQTDSTYRQIELGFMWGALSTDLNQPLRNTTMTRYRLQLDVSHYSRIANLADGDLGLFVGGGLDNLLVFRESSFAGLNFGEFAGSLSIQPKIHYDFPLLKHKARLSYNLGFPVITFLIRQGYANAPPAGFREDEDNSSFISKALESGEWVLGFIRFDSQLKLSYYLSNGNFLSLAYGFDYYEYDDPERVAAVSHSFMFGTAFNF